MGMYPTLTTLRGLTIIAEEKSVVGGRDSSLSEPQSHPNPTSSTCYPQPNLGFPSTFENNSVEE